MLNDKNKKKYFKNINKKLPESTYQVRNPDNKTKIIP
jgi:hypothetical protein